MKTHSDIAWHIASLYGRFLGSETRDLAAHIDEALKVWQEACAKQAENFYKNPNLEPHLLPALEVGDVCGKQIAEAIRGMKLPPADRSDAEKTGASQS